MIAHKGQVRAVSRYSTAAALSLASRVESWKSKGTSRCNAGNMDSTYPYAILSRSQSESYIGMSKNSEITITKKSIQDELRNAKIALDITYSLEVREGGQEVCTASKLEYQKELRKLFEKARKASTKNYRIEQVA